MQREHFITSEALEQKLEDKNIRILCNFMGMPGTPQNGYEEYLASRIPGAIYFDIDEIADKSNPLPHMVADPDQFADQLGKMGISNNHEIIIYDKTGLFSAARVWWNLRIMGAKNLRILEGGFERWVEESRPTESGTPKTLEPALFSSSFESHKVIDASELLEKINQNEVTILDARSRARFYAEVDEPRPSLKKGHMPGANPLPFTELLENGTLISNEKLREIFKPFVETGTPIVTSCGSGVTAAVLSLALVSAGYEDHRLYDGSWTEWADPDNNYPVVQQ